MKKTIFALMLLLVSLVTMAATGNTRAQAIPFDWDSAYTRAMGTSWFSMDVSEIKQKDNPTLALYMTNLSSTSTVTVKASLFLGTSSSSLEETELTLGPGQYRIMSANVGVLKSMETVNTVILRMQSSGSTESVVLSAKAYETGRIDVSENGCKSSGVLVVDGAASSVAAAGSTQWYNFDIDPYITASKQLRAHITTAAGAAVSAELSYDCPCTGTTSYAMTGSGDIIVPGNVLAVIAERRAYLKVTSSASFSVNVVEEDAPAEAPTTGITPIVYDYDQGGAGNVGYALAVGDNWFEFDLDTLINERVTASVVLTATAGADVTAGVAYKDGANYFGLEEYDWSFAGTRGSHILENNVISGLRLTSYNKVYYNLHTTTAGVTFRMVLKPSSSAGEDCEGAVEMQVSVSGTTPTAEYEATQVNDDYFGKLYIDQFKTNGATPCDLEITLTNLESTSNTIKMAMVNCGVTLSDDAYETRTLAAGESRVRTILHSQFESLDNSLFFRVKATGKYILSITSIPTTPLVSPDDACLTATTFDWRYGHNLAAGADAWFEVDLDTVHNTANVPVLKFANSGTATADVTVQYAYECPVTFALPAAEHHHVAAGTTYEEAYRREQLMQVSGRKMWVHLTSDKPVWFGIQFEEDHSQSDRLCAVAYDFNWVGGNTQDPSTAWYAIDLQYAKDNGYPDIQIRVENTGSAKATVNADLAFKCTADPQTQPFNMTVAAGQTRPAVGSYSNLITRDLYETKDTIWVRIQTNQPIRFYAELVTPPAFTPITACSSATLFEFDHEYTLSAAETWFYLPVDTFFSAALAPDYYVPEVMITNPSASAQDLLGEVAFHCPVVSAMTGKTQTIAAGSTFKKSLERAMIDGYLDGRQGDTLFFRATADPAAGIKFSASMVNNNLGNDCAHAIDLIYGTEGHRQRGDMEVWYKIDFTAAHGKKVVAGIENLVDHSQQVNSSLFLNCLSDSLAGATRTLGANADISKEIGELIAGFGADYIYLRVRGTDSVRVYAYFDGDLPTGPELNVCNDPSMLRVEPNVHYYQGQPTLSTGVWYYVDKAALDTTTTGDVTLTITPHGATPVDLHAELYWQCHTTDLPVTRDMSISGVYNYTISRDAIDAIGRDSAFVLLTASDSIDWIINVNRIAGYDCEHHIDFDWNFCNVHPAGDTLWYRVPMDTMEAIYAQHDTVDIVVYIENMANVEAHLDMIEMVLDCGDAIANGGVSTFPSYQKTLAPQEVTSKVVDYSLLKDLSLTDLGVLMRVTADQQIRICVDTIAERKNEHHYDSLEVVVCQGADFADAYGRYSFTVNEDTILRDTIVYQNMTFYDDSIVYYNIHVTKPSPFAQPATSADLTSLSMLAGHRITNEVLTAILTELKDSIAASPYVSAINESESIDWMVSTEWDDVNQQYVNYQPINSTAYTDLYATELALLLSYTDTCDAGVMDTLHLTLAANPLCGTQTIDTIVCPGTFTYKGTLINSACTLRDTLHFFNDTLAFDTIVVYNFAIFTANRPAAMVATAQSGQLVVLDTTALLTDFREASLNVNPAPVDTVIWYALVDNAWGDAATTFLPTTQDTVWVRYELTTACGDVVRDTVLVQATAPVRVTRDVEEKICFGATFTGRLGEVKTANVASQTWNDTVFNIVNADPAYRFDSIYHYTLTTYVPGDTVRKDTTICQGSDYLFLGQTYSTEQVDLFCVLPTVDGCDSIYGVLNLHIAQPYDFTAKDTLCAGDAYVWDVDGVPFTFLADTMTAGVHVYTKTLASIYGCDSVLRLELTIGAVADTAIYHKSSCLGSDYTWNGHRTIAVADSAAGVYEFRDSVISPLGCVSHVDILILKIVAPTTTEFTGSVCANKVYNWVDGGKQINAANLGVGVHKDTVIETSVLGCDSFLVLTLTVNPIYLADQFTETAEICEGDAAGYTWVGHKNDIVYTGLAVGTHTFYDSLTTVGCGCDSIHRLVLTVNPRYTTDVYDTLCVNTLIDLGLNPSAVVNAAGDYVERQLTVSGCDSLFVHHVTLKTFPTLPQNTQLDTVPQVVCGQQPNLEPINKAIADYLEANYQPTDKRLQSIAWQVQVGQSWQYLDDSQVLSYTNEEEFKFRYIAYIECGDSLVSKAFSVTVEKPSSDNIYSAAYVPVVPKYDDWLILLNVVEARKVLQQQGLPTTFTEANVYWYEQVGTLDPLGADGLPDGDDQPAMHVDNSGKSSNNGYYHTTNQQLMGTYYAVIVFADTIPSYPCGAAVRSDLYSTGTVAPSNNNGNNGNNANNGDNGNNGNNSGIGGGGRPTFPAPIIAPTLVRPGDDIYVYNINPDVVTTIEVFNLMGESVSRIEVQGEQTVTYTTSDDREGCFLMNISSEQDTRSLKFIVK